MKKQIQQQPREPVYHRYQVVNKTQKTKDVDSPQRFFFLTVRSISLDSELG